MATLRQIHANTLNATKSTGPKTEAGKARARANALKHGLSGDGVVMDAGDRAAVQKRLDDWRDAYHPAGAAQEWLYHQMVVNSVRVDRCHEEESALREYVSGRAETAWDDDRMFAAEELGARLSKRPALTVLRLRQTRQGADWLIGRWVELAEALEAGGTWSDDERSRAFDLLGTPREFRFRAPWEAPEVAITEFVEKQIVALETLQAEALDELDAIERAAAESGFLLETPLPSAPAKGQARLRRYEGTAWKRYEWARKRLEDPSLIVTVPSRLAPMPPEAPEPSPSPTPPPDDEPPAPVDETNPTAPCEGEVDREVSVELKAPILTGATSYPEYRMGHALAAAVVADPTKRPNRRERRAAERHASRSR